MLDHSRCSPPVSWLMRTTRQSPPGFARAGSSQIESPISVAIRMRDSRKARREIRGNRRHCGACTGRFRVQRLARGESRGQAEQTHCDGDRPAAFRTHEQQPLLGMYGKVHDRRVRVRKFFRVSGSRIHPDQVPTRAVDHNRVVIQIERLRGVELIDPVANANLCRRRCSVRPVAENGRDLEVARTPPVAIKR